MKLGDILIDKGLITEEQLQYTLAEQRGTGERLGEALIRLSIITDRDLAEVISEQSNLPFYVPEEIEINEEALKRVPIDLARRYAMLPIKLEAGELHIAVADPFNEHLKTLLFRVTGLPIKIYVAPEVELRYKIEAHYYLLEHPIEKEVQHIIFRLRQDPNFEVNYEEVVEKLFIDAALQGISDIHITPSNKSLRVMYRYQGVLVPRFVFPRPAISRIIANIKVRSNLDIAEQRKPQDGRTSFNFLGKSFDVRVSTVNTINGENIVLRLLGSSSSLLSVRKLGFSTEQVDELMTLFAKPYGMVLVTGPTGSGKTTTLYAAMRMLDSIRKNIMTAEDPVEYILPLIRQTQVNERIGYTFASALRSFLRQDPDIILIGEIRDHETAALASEAALTGHLVLSTIHTNTAIGSISRLRELQINNDQLASSLIGVVAQRLVRTICENCKTEYIPQKKLLKYYNLPTDRKYIKGAGCDKCLNTGYSGRTVVAELFVVKDKITAALAHGASLYDIEMEAKKAGMTFMLDHGKQKVIDGITTVEELFRCLG